MSRGTMRRSPKKRRDTMRGLTRPRPSVRQILYVQQAGRCWYCGADVSYAELTIDHTVPVSQGGVSTMANLRGSCLACNRAKGTRSLNAYRAQCGGQPFWGETR